MKLLDRGSVEKMNFAILMGVGWNLKFPVDAKPGTNNLKKLYDKYRNFIDVRVDPISKGCLNEYFYCLQNGIPAYDMGIFLSELRLVPSRLDIVEEQKGFWNSASLLGLKYDD